MFKTSIKIFVFIFSAVIFFTACEKDNLSNITENQDNDNTEQRILEFKKKVESANKSDEIISIDSAVWFIEAALNYTYCILEDETIFEESIAFTDSAKIDIIVDDNSVNFSNIAIIYNEFLQVIANTIEDDIKKVYLVDIEFKDDTISCKYDFVVKSSNKGFPINIFTDLNYDWHSGAACYVNMGRCDGTYPEKSAATVWSKCITWSKGIPFNAFFTDIQKGKWYYNPNNNTTPELDTMLFKGYFETPPCITSDDMYKYYYRGKTIANRYIPPTGWGVPKVEYITQYSGIPGWQWTILKVFKGKINPYSPPQ